MSGSASHAPPSWLRSAPPGILLLLIVGLDAVNGGINVLGPSAMVPMLAANLLSPRATAAYGAVTVAVTTAVGYDDLHASAATRNAQVTRLSLIAIAGLIAVLAAVARRRREVQLRVVQGIAEVAQRAILPPIPSRIGSLRLSSHYESAAAEASIGGDFYAAVETQFGVRLLMGDVKGKGLDAVRLASVVLGVFRERAHERRDLSGLIVDLDAAVARETDDEDFATAVVVEISADGTARLASAGHPLPLTVATGGGLPAAATGTGAPLGLGDPLRVRRPRPIPFQLAPGDRLLLFTDGLTEARRSGDRAFFPAEEAVSGILGRGDLDHALTALRGELLKWTGPHLSDDVALLAVEFDPQA